MDVDTPLENEMNGSKNEDVRYAEEKTMAEIIDTLKVIAKTTASLDHRYIWRALKELVKLGKTT